MCFVGTPTCLAVQPHRSPIWQRKQQSCKRPLLEGLHNAEGWLEVIKSSSSCIVAKKQLEQSIVFSFTCRLRCLLFGLPKTFCHKKLGAAAMPHALLRHNALSAPKLLSIPATAQTPLSRLWLTLVSSEKIYGAYQPKQQPTIIVLPVCLKTWLERTIEKSQRLSLTKLATIVTTSVPSKTSNFLRISQGNCRKRCQNALPRLLRWALNSYASPGPSAGPLAARKQSLSNHELPAKRFLNKMFVTWSQKPHDMIQKWNHLKYPLVLSGLDILEHFFHPCLLNDAPQKR